MKFVIDNRRENYRYDKVDQNMLRNEARSLKIGGYDREKDNYVDLENGKIVWNDYKTSGSMKRQEFEISEKIEKELGVLISRRERNGEEMLFVKQDGKGFNTGDFGNFMIRGLESYMGGRRIGSQMMRKIYVSEERCGEKSIAEKKEMSRRMLHSVGMSEKYRRM